ncbi:MAG TPA: AmmeMemoRadiSam system protein B [Thermoplasmatales archaeon]|nr:AmmeMemoRadiSam system protein B [Thermoplasmatales archaeon]
MLRKPVVAGTFYERDRELLAEEIKQCFLKGVGKIPEVKKGRGKIKGVVVPHAGYYYSGYVASYAYNEIAKDGFPDKFIIIGPNHAGYGGVSIMIDGEWETPLGNVTISEDAKKYCRGVIKDNKYAHQIEHSIEVQLPFLQFLSNDFKFIPICLGYPTLDDIKEAGKILSEVEDAVFIASTDFSHLDAFAFSTPEEIKKYAEEKDMMAIKEILKIDGIGLLKKVMEHNITMCGHMAVATMLEALKGKASKARLLKYATSYDVEPGIKCVGYASIVIE